MYMWLALHAYRQAHLQQYAMIIQHAQKACDILRTWIHGNSVEIADAKESPKQVKAARKAKGKTASTRAVAAATGRSTAKASKSIPTTPKRPGSRCPNPAVSVVSNLCIP
jgi:hypothetical protein